MTDVLPALATVTAVAGVLALAAFVVGTLGRRHLRLGRRGVDWATSLGISAVLSFVLGLIMVTLNVGLTSAFPAAFLTSLLIGVVVGTPTAYLVVPRILRLTTPLGAPARPSAPDGQVGGRDPTG